MTSADQQSYINLINDLRQASRDMNILLINIKKYENYILRGLVINDNISFNNELTQLKETLSYKINKIRNEIIPALYAILRAN